MNSLNRVYILGTLGTTPVLSNTRDGKPFCKLRVATDNYSPASSDDGEKKSTDWHYVHVFGRQAETSAQYLAKGKQVLVEGKLFSQPLGEKDGRPVWRTWINADRVTFLSGGKRDSFLPDENEKAEEPFAASGEAPFAVSGDYPPGEIH